MHKLIKHGWTQERIAKELGVTQAAVSLWLSGKRKFRGPVVKVLEDVLKREGLA